MGTENEVGDPTTSTRSVASLHVEQPSQDDNDRQTQPTKEETTERVPLHKLFSFADSTDMALMILGSAGAVANGACMPLMSILFGDLINAFGENQFNHLIVKEVSKVSLKFVYLAIGVAVAAFLRKHIESDNTLSSFRRVLENEVEQSMSCVRGGLLDGHWRKTGSKSKESVFENYTETRHWFLR
ncbi:hypothetical protein Ancab_020406 [Ancistrocladus abbreviatus]